MGQLSAEATYYTYASPYNNKGVSAHTVRPISHVQPIASLILQCIFNYGILKPKKQTFSQASIISCISISFSHHSCGEKILKTALHNFYRKNRHWEEPQLMNLCAVWYCIWSTVRWKITVSWCRKNNSSKGLHIQRFKRWNIIQRAMASQPNLAVIHRYPMAVTSQKSTSLKQQNQIF